MHIFSELQTSSFLFQNNYNSSNNGALAKEDLHISIMDSNNLKQSIKLLAQQMSERLRTNEEFWLIDISALQSIENARQMLNNLHLDIDDDIFLFMFKDNDLAYVWEIYKLVPRQNLIIRELGEWTHEIGMDMTSLGKWKRRGDLSVILGYMI